MNILTKNLFLDILQIASEMPENGIFFFMRGGNQPPRAPRSGGLRPLRPPAENVSSLNAAKKHSILQISVILDDLWPFP